MRGMIGWGLASAAVAALAAFGGYQFGSNAKSEQPWISAASLTEAQKPAAAAAPAPAGTLDKAQVESIVRNYLISNPEIVAEMQVALEEKQREEQRIAALGAIKNSKDAIFRSSADAILGNPNGKTTIVEFYDYNCGYCKRAMGDMIALTKADPELRFVLKELPILGPDSQKAHVVSQAFHRIAPGKYADFHLKLLGFEGRATEDAALAIAQELGVDLAALKAEMAKPEVIQTLVGNRQLADELQITGTPSYVVGDEIIFGAMGEAAIASKIANARAQCQTAAC